MDTSRQDFARALQHLLDNGIQPIEWGDQVSQSYGVPVMVESWKFIIADSDMKRALHLVVKAGLQPTDLTDRLGSLKCPSFHKHVFISPSRQHAINLELHILPQSTMHLTIDDTDLHESLLSDNLYLYRPRVPELCLSLVRCIDECQVAFVKLEIRNHLSYLTCVQLYKEDITEKLWVPEEETESEEDFQVRRSAVLENVKNWQVEGDRKRWHERFISYL